MRYGLDKWTVRWSENWLNCQAEGLDNSNMKFRILLLVL